MHDATLKWRCAHARRKMVVLVALTAAMYVAVMLPFKALVIIPGFAEVRPGVAIPIVCGMLFGPAAAWGSAFGNVIGDIAGGMLSLGSIFGFVGNFLLAYLPYRVWRTVRGAAPADGSAKGVPALVLGALAGSCACSLSIGLGLQSLGLFPMSLFTPIIAVANTVFMSVLGAMLLPLLYPRANKWGLIYTDTLPERDVRRTSLAWPGLAVLLIGSIAGVLLAANDIPVGLAKQAAANAQQAVEQPISPDEQPSAPPAEVSLEADPWVPRPFGLTLLQVTGACTLITLLGTVMMSPFGRSAAKAEAVEDET